MAQKVTLPIATQVTVETTKDGEATGLFFKTLKDEVIGISIRKQGLSRLTALLLEQAGRVAAAVTPDDPPRTMTATPILASHLGFALGRNDSEALVSFRVGNLDLTFALDIAVLHGQCTLLSKATKTAPQIRQ